VSLSLDQLSAEDVETGKSHPFVRALVRELAQRHAAAVTSFESAGRDSDPVLRYYSTRAATFREVLSIIERAKGVDDGP